MSQLSEAVNNQPVSDAGKSLLRRALSPQTHAILRPCVIQKSKKTHIFYMDYLVLWRLAFYFRKHLQQFLIKFIKGTLV